MKMSIRGPRLDLMMTIKIKTLSLNEKELETNLEALGNKNFESRIFKTKTCQEQTLTCLSTMESLHIPRTQKRLPN